MFYQIKIKNKDLMKPFFLIAAIIITVISCITLCKQKNELKVGDRAPDFTLPDQNGTMHTLSQLRGKNVVLYFYPMDDTQGCSKQACNLRDHYANFTDADIVLLGLSKGSTDSKLSFATKLSLPYPLLSVTNKTLVDYNTNGGFFRAYLPKRYTFLINKEGIIIAIIKDVSINQHSRQIINEFNRVQ
jgi:peroxiredoxin Q/BCP